MALGLVLIVEWARSNFVFIHISIYSTIVKKVSCVVAGAAREAPGLEERSRLLNFDASGYSLP